MPLATADSSPAAGSEDLPIALKPPPPPPLLLLLLPLHPHFLLLFPFYRGSQGLPYSSALSHTFIAS